MNRVIVTAALASALLLPGCATTSHPYSKSEEVVQRTADLEHNTVVFVDYNLNRTTKNRLTGWNTNVARISVENQGIDRTATGTSQVWVVLRNHTDYPQQLEARTQFFTASGRPVDATPAWKRVHVPANSVTTYEELSVTTGHLNYLVEIKEGS